MKVSEAPAAVYLGDNGEDIYFTRTCPKCGRFVQADKSVLINSFTGEVSMEANATCTKCGRVTMELEGWY